MKRPIGAWDAQAWLQFLHKRKDHWNCPGGLSYDAFLHRLVLSVVPDGWIKPGYGPTAKGKERKDIGKGHATFLTIYGAGALDSLDEHTTAPKQIRFAREIVDYFFRAAVEAIASNDSKFFPDFWQAVEDWRESVEINQPLLAAVNRKNEFMVLTVIVEDGSASFTVKRLQELVKRKFQKSLDWKAVDKVAKRLGIRKTTIHKTPP